MTKPLFFLISGILALSACTQKAPDTQYHFNFYLRYVQPIGELRAEAKAIPIQNNPEGTAAEIPGGIRFLDKPMTFVTAKGASYLTNVKKPLPDSCSFSWTSSDAKTHVFNAHIEPMLAFGFNTKTLERSKPASFRWEGSPLSAGESMVFLWEKIGMDETKNMEIINVGSIPGIEFPAAKLAELSAGKWTYYIVRRKLQKPEYNGEPINLVTEYYSKTDTLDVL